MGVEGDAMARDDAWFEELFRRHHRAVTSYCLRRVAPADASDVVAQVFAVAWRRRDDVPSGERALPWLYGVARRTISHQWRGARRAQRLVEKAGGQRPTISPGPEAMVESSAEHQRVREAVRQLSSMDREVLLLSAWEGLTHTQIADTIGCSRAAVDKRIVRAKTRLAARYRALSGGARTGAPDRPADPRFSQRASTKEVKARESG